MRLLLIKIALRISAFLPLPLAHALGILVGWLLILIPNRLARDTQSNIHLCFPELSSTLQGRLVRGSLVETGKTIIETGALWLRPGPDALRRIRSVDGLKHVEHAIGKGRGMILATPHLGAWEAAGLYGAANFNMTCLYRPLRIAEMENLVRTARNRLGASYVPTTTGGIRTLYRTLEQGGTVAMLPDQEPRAGTGTFAPFFGNPAYTMVLLARLAAATGAPVVLAWCERLAWGRGYHLHFRAAPQGVGSRDTRQAASTMNLAIEQLIRECPPQYQWSYRRFRTRPKGEPRRYDKSRDA